MPYASKEKRNEYKNQYNKEHYYSLQIKMVRGDADFIRRAATAAGMTTSQYVLAAVREKVQRESK